MSIRIIVQVADCAAAANVGGPVDVSHRTFLIEHPEIEKLLTEKASYTHTSVIGAEVVKLEPEPEPPKVPKPVVMPLGGPCECGHEAKRHTDVGCLFPTNDLPIGKGRVYCLCTKYVEAATVTEVKATVEGGEVELVPTPHAPVKPEPADKMPAPVGDCTWTRAGNKCLWPSHSENGAPCETVSTGQPCGMFGK